MAKASTQQEAARAPKSYAKRMCDNVAIALVVYTLMLIFVTARLVDPAGRPIHTGDNMALPGAGIDAAPAADEAVAVAP